MEERWSAGEKVKNLFVLMTNSQRVTVASGASRLSVVVFDQCSKERMMLGRENMFLELSEARKEL